MRFMHFVAAPSIAGVMDRAVAFEGYEISSTGHSQISVNCTAASHSSTPLIPTTSSSTSQLVKSTKSDTADYSISTTQSATLSETSSCFTITMTSTTVLTKTVYITNISGSVVTVTTGAVTYNTIASPANSQSTSPLVGTSIVNSSHPTSARQTQATAGTWSNYGAVKSTSRTFSVLSSNATMTFRAPAATTSNPISPYTVQKNLAVGNEVAVVLLLMGYILAAGMWIYDE